jgi:hypothetical protein
MSDLSESIHPDSDWARLGVTFSNRRKAFQRLERPTPQQLAELRLQPKGKRRKRGPMGRPRKSPDMVRAAELRRRGFTWADIGERMNVHRNTLLARRKEIEQHST